jgi:hypothetical protein
LAGTTLERRKLLLEDVILTLEDPIEQVFEEGRARISQREIGQDAPDFASAARAALRSDADLVMIGEIRDAAAARSALALAESGHRVLASLHAGSAVSAISRLVALLADEHGGTRDREALADHLGGVLCQQLVMPERAGEDRRGRLVLYDTVSQLPSVAAASNAGELGLDVGARTIVDRSGAPTLPILSVAPMLPVSELKAQSARWIRDAAPGFIGMLDRWMREQGAALALFTYRQPVQVQGASRPRWLVWQLTLQTGPRAQYGDPRVIDPSAGPIEVRYRPRALSAGLPADWAPPDGGSLAWRLLDVHQVPVSEWQRIDAGGAWDEPASTDGQPVDPDAGLRCLANRRLQGHCASAPDVQSLLDQTGAPYALLGYVRSLKPVYQTVHAADDGLVQTPQLSLAVDVREWQRAGCSSGRYRNAGSWGLALVARTEYYRVDPGGSAQYLRAEDTSSMSPRVSYDVVHEGLTGESAQSLADRLVDPHRPDGPLLPMGALAGLVNAVPVTALEASTMTRVHADIYHGWCGRAVAIEAHCQSDGSVSLTFGGGANVAWCPADDSMFGTRTWTLERGHPLSDQGYPGTDRIPGVVWRWDGAGRVTFVRAPDAIFQNGQYLPAMQLFAWYAFGSTFGSVTRAGFPAGGPVSFWFESPQCPEGTLQAGSFSSIDPRPADLASACLVRDDSAGSLRTCQGLDDFAGCFMARLVEPVWVERQQIEWRPCDLTCVAPPAPGE